MFGGVKQTFGTTTTGTGFGSFANTSTTSPFGPSSYGKAPNTVFGGGSAFSTQQPTSLFGVAGGQTQQTGLFGTPGTSSAFGGATTTQPTFGGFSQPQQNASIFGTAQPAANTNAMFGQPNASAFGTAVKPSGLGGFGHPATQSTSLFGQPVASTSTGFSTFGQTAATSSNVFGNAASAFGQTAAANTAGTSITKYQPTIGTDTLMKGGQPNNINTKHQCITAMNEYEAKSLEELRYQDYLANRRGPQAGTSGTTGFFGTTQPTATSTNIFGPATQPNSGLFGQPQAAPTENKGLFSASAFGNTTSAFGTTQQNNFLAKPFAVTNSIAFGNTATDGAANPFGAKPAFGQTTTPGIFGQPPAVSTAPAFGQTNTGFGVFASTAAGTQQPSLFGQPNVGDANKPTFGLGAATANTGFGSFGVTNTSAATGGLFSAKPATAFAPAQNTGFTNLSMNNTGTTGAFSSNFKPGTGFMNQTTQSFPGLLNFNSGTGGSSLFNNTAAKPGGLFNNIIGTSITNTGGSLLGGGTNTTGNNTLGSAFGNYSLGGNSLLGGVGGTMAQQPIPIHQQILSKVTSPYGDNPIFKDLKRSEESDVLRATNPVAQKAILDLNSSNQFKVSTKPSGSCIRVKPVGSALTKKALFEGLEEFDSSIESFSLKPSVKRLIIKPKAVTMTPTSINDTNIQSTNNVSASNGSGGNSCKDNSDIQSESYSNENSVTSPRISGANAPNVMTSGQNDLESSRRESWLHPNNLEQVRQRNLENGRNTAENLNNTMPELVSRKPLETYRPIAAVRASLSIVAENPFIDTPSGSPRQSVTFGDESVASDSVLSMNSFARDEGSTAELMLGDEEEHPTGITLRRVGYYTIPSLDELKSYLAEDESCVVPNFTIGREGYGNVYFGKEIDIAGLNLDDIVHFRHKEVIIYPDDDNKPPVGTGLNREAQVTLDQVWPHDKTKHEPIKDPQRLGTMDWEGKLRRVCDKSDTRFIEYRPETGSWVFRVKHFSKYGLNDSDEEEDNLPADPKKAKLGVAVPGVKGAQKKPPQQSTSEKDKNVEVTNNAVAGDNQANGDPQAFITSTGLYSMDRSGDYLLMDKSLCLQSELEYMGLSQNRRSVVSSPSAALAKDIGTDSHKLQLMKASLFNNDDDTDSGKNTLAYDNYADYNRNGSIRMGTQSNEYLKTVQTQQRDVDGIRSKPSHQDEFALRASPPPAPSPSASVLSIPREIHSKSASPRPGGPPADGVRPIASSVQLHPFRVTPKVTAVKPFASQVPLGKSITFSLTGRWTTDMGIYYDRRFKVGFGLQNTLTVPISRSDLERDVADKNVNNMSKVFQVRKEDDFSSNILQQVQIASITHYEHFDESIVEHLQIQLRNSQQVDVEGSECPWIRSDGGTELILKHLDASVKLVHMGNLEEYASSVWSLCLALWGDQNELEGRDPNSHFVVMTRRSLVSDWLMNILNDHNQFTKDISKQTYLDHLLELVMCYKVAEGCEMAIMYDDINLALLLAQLSSGPSVRQLMEDQLAAWHKCEADKFIQLERLKLFMLVAGVPLMNSNHGPINILEGISWLKALAIYLWYLCSPTSSITDALLAYEKSFQTEEFYSLPPTPNYEEKIKLSGKRATYDLRYHILQLFSKRSHPMESLLNPATHTPDPMDFRLSWLLLETLTALGYCHCSEFARSQLHVNFASQLENYDLWEWSIFVLLHISDRNQRELAVQNVLYRYVTISKSVALSEKEKFVINNLGVPEKWIDYAKAVKAGSIGNWHLQTKYLLKAKQWSQAHEVIFQHIAPDAVINENLDYLHSLLSQFENADPSKNVKVPNWSNQGQIFLDFIDIAEKFSLLKTLETEDDIAARWENLKPQLAELCSRINLMPCPTSKHRLCQSEIAQSLACLLRGVLVVCSVLNPFLIIQIALERLPLPQEFAQQELRELLDKFVGDLSTMNADNNEEMLVKE